MIPSAAVQHREKHFNLLLARELDYLEREHEQNLLTIEKLEKFVEFEHNQTKILRRRKHYLTPINHKSNEHYEPSVIESSVVNSDIQSDVSTSSNHRKYHRQCYKGQRLPPLTKSNRHKRKKLHSTSKSDIQSENFTLISEPLPAISVPKLTVLDQQIQTFMEALPKYQGLEKGFDNFAPSSLYSNRARIAMR